MTKRTEVRFNLSGLEEIKRKVGNTYRARVGVLGAHAARTDETMNGINNATLMLIHVYGSITNNLPPRDPLFQPIIRHRRELIQKMGSGSMRAAFEAGNYYHMFELLGVAGEEIVQQAFETGGDGTWPDIKKATKRAKGSSQILIDSGQMRRAVTSDVVKTDGEAKGAIVSAGGQ